MVVKKQGGFIYHVQIIRRRRRAKSAVAGAPIFVVFSFPGIKLVYNALVAKALRNGQGAIYGGEDLIIEGMALVVWDRAILVAVKQYGGDIVVGGVYPTGIAHRAPATGDGFHLVVVRISVARAVNAAQVGLEYAAVVGRGGPFGVVQVG